VIRALETAKASRLATVGFTGCTGGKVKALADYCICVPSTETPRIQECHILAGHIISELVEDAIFRH
jgi:D-sedoheptulose 7-phosphate isomerase